MPYQGIEQEEAYDRLRTENWLEDDLSLSEYVDIDNVPSSSQEALCKILGVDDENRKMLALCICMGKMHMEEEFIVAMNNLVNIIIESVI